MNQQQFELAKDFKKKNPSYKNTRHEDVLKLEIIRKLIKYIRPC